MSVENSFFILLIFVFNVITLLTTGKSYSFYWLKFLTILIQLAFTKGKNLMTLPFFFQKQELRIY